MAATLTAGRARVALPFPVTEQLPVRLALIAFVAVLALFW